MVDWHERGRLLESVWAAARSTPHAFELTGIPIRNERTQRRALASLRGMGFNLPTINEEYRTHVVRTPPSSLKMRDGATSFVITSCTNNSTIDGNFFDALEKFAEAKDAQLLVVPVPYRNNDYLSPLEDYKWDDRIYPYAVTDPIQLSESLIIEQADIRATAVRPLTGMQPIGGTSSVVYGHPQMAMQMVAAPADEIPKMMHTTGSCNYAAYSNSQAGRRAKTFHTISALYITLDGDKFKVIQLGWDGEGFNYYEERWTAEGRQADERVAGLHMGDYHAYWALPEIVSERAKLLDRIDPEELVWNDLLDFHSQSHHNTKMDKIRIAASGDHLVEKEIKDAARHVNEVGAGRVNLIVQSNHDDALTRWLNRFRDDQDPHNAPFYYDLMRNWFNNPDKLPIELAMELLLDVDYEFLSRNKTKKIRGVSIEQHGDKGVNGARGSGYSFANTMHKMIVGHSHTPGIYHGTWVNGTSTDAQEYKQGLSSWMLCDIMIYQSGKRAFVFYI